MEGIDQTDQAEDEARFRRLYADAYGDVLRFVARRVHPSHAEDVAAEVFLVVWRRLDETPPELDAARAWLFGVARGVLLNTHRGQRRRQALVIRIARMSETHETNEPVASDRTTVHVDLTKAWARLTPTDQEALALTYWDELTSTQAAAVLAISPVAFRLRLTRARRHLARHLDLMDPSSAHPVPEWSTS